MTDPALSDGALALLLFHLPLDEGPKQLNRRELLLVIRRLKLAGEPLGALINAPDSALAICAGGSLDRERLSSLLDRKPALDTALGRWRDLGIWTLSVADAGYPGSLCDRLGRATPFFLFGVGPCEALRQRALGIVGSRAASPQALDFCLRLGRRCGREALRLVTGGAKGVDTAAAEACLGSGGQATVVLADGLADAVCGGRYRSAVEEGRLTLACPYRPDMHFHRGNAMGRNKVIYALSEWSIVVEFEPGRGGTWRGATENLRREWAPLFVRSAACDRAGDWSLLDLSAMALYDDGLWSAKDTSEWLEKQATALVGEYRWRSRADPRAVQQRLLELSEPDAGAAKEA